MRNRNPVEKIKERHDKKAAAMTIRSYIWISFIIFTLIILALLWVFQYVFIKGYYSSMKAQMLYEAADVISKNIDSPHIEGDLRDLAFKNSLCIVVTDRNGRVIFLENTLGSYSFYELDIKGQDGQFLKSLRDDLDNRIEENPENGSITKKYENEDFKSLELFYVEKLETQSGDRYVYLEATVDPIDSTTAIIKNQLVYISIILLEVSFIITLFISQRLSRPIVNITKTAKKFAEGDYKTEFKSQSYQEVNELSEVLDNARVEVSKVSNLRRDLISNVSHDLRTPLTIIKSYAEMVRDLSGDNPEKRQEHLKVIIDESDRLSALVSSLLEISKLESGNMELEITEFPLHEKMTEVKQRYEILNLREGYNITFVEDTDVICRCDSSKIDQVLYNLINNAVNYCGEGKSITIRQINKPNFVRIQVTDDGAGIAREKLPMIFDRYYRDERSQRDKIGTGLGLSIVKEILKMHKFPFGVISEEGKGSTFWFEIAVVPQE